MVIFILAAEGLEVGGVVPLTGVGLLGEGGKGAADRDFIERPELQTIYPAPIAEVLEHLPGDHGALATGIRGDDDPLHVLEGSLDLIDLGLVRLT